MAGGEPAREHVVTSDPENDADRNEYQEDHIPNAISLNEDRWNEELPQFLAQWAPEKKVVVYCSTKSCNLAGDVARRLRDEAQLKNVFVLEGGWEEWLKKR